MLRVNEEDRCVLRQLGIRTATDLQDALELKAPCDLTDDQLARRLAVHRRRVEPLATVLNTGERESWPPILETVVASLRNEPNLHHVRHWKEFSQTIAPGGKLSLHG